MLMFRFFIVLDLEKKKPAWNNTSFWFLTRAFIILYYGRAGGLYTANTFDGQSRRGVVCRVCR